MRIAYVNNRLLWSFVHSVFLLACVQTTLLHGQTDANRERGERGQNSGSRLGNYETPPPANDIPAHLYDIVLVRPRYGFSTTQMAKALFGFERMENKSGCKRIPSSFQTENRLPSYWKSWLPILVTSTAGFTLGQKRRTKP